MRIVVDERETAIYDKMDTMIHLDSQGIGTIQLVKKVLPLGDIIIQTDEEQNIAIIERKSFSDLLSSIKDGRYEEQSYRLKHSSEIPPHNIIYMIEGMFSQLRTILEKKTIHSAITSLILFKGFSVLRTCSLQETAETIVWMACKMERDFQKGKAPFYQNIPSETPTPPQAPYCSVVKKVKKENITPENIGEIFLCQIPGISSTTAIAVMNHYKTFSNLLEGVRTCPSTLDTITYESNGKTRKISKTCSQNIIAYLGNNTS
jgi:ERCC4-type nuclease